MDQFIDEIKLEGAIGKLRMYHKEESICFDSTIKLLRELTTHYVTENTIFFDTFNDEMMSKFRAIQMNQQTDIEQMEKTLSGYRETKKKVEKRLEDMI